MIELQDYADDRRSPSRRRSWLVSLLAVPLLLVATVAVVAQRADDGADQAEVVPPDPDGDGQDEVALELVPQAAWDGRASLLHPVTVEPASGLVPGQTVAVTGALFPPNSDYGVVMCTSQAVQLGVNACNIGDFASGMTDADGTFSTTFTVSRYLTVGNEVVDCMSGNIDPAEWLARRAAGEPPMNVTDPTRFSCIIAVGLLSDYDQSGGFPISFEGAVTGPDAPPVEGPPITMPVCPDYSVPPPTTVIDLGDGHMLATEDVSVPVGCPPPPMGWYASIQSGFSTTTLLR